MTENEIREFASRYETRARDADLEEEIRHSLNTAKVAFVAENDQVGAKRIWVLEQTLSLQYRYFEAFDLIRSGQYYEAWCMLERAEIIGLFLVPHATADERESFGISRTVTNIEKWQSLFPYRKFFSPEILQLEKTCTICGNVVKIRKPCGHQVGQIYNGELCGRNVSKAEFVGISLVDNPVQKYSVLFSTDQNTGRNIDNYDYSMLQYVARAVETANDEWSVEKNIKRHPKKMFSALSGDSRCPCGSGRKFKKCCKSKRTVRMPHFVFHFKKMPAGGDPGEVVRITDTTRSA